MSLLPAERVLAVGAEVEGVLAGHGWPPRPGTSPAAGRDADWFRADIAVQERQAFHRLAHEPALLEVVAAVLGVDTAQILAHPRKSVTFQETEAERETACTHAATADVITAWVPLEPAASAIAVVPGSAAARHAALPGNGPPRLGEWLTLSVAPGDVVLLHGLTLWRPGSAAGGRSPLAARFHYQRVDEPVELAALQPHNYGNAWMHSWGELSRGWGTLEGITLPDSLNVATVESSAPPRSRLLDEFAGAGDRHDRSTR